MSLEFPKAEAEILAEIKAEIKESRDFVQEKRAQFHTRLKIFHNQRKNSGKVGDTLMFNIIDTMMAASYANEPQAIFAARGRGGQDDAAVLKRVASFDYDEMDMEVTDHDVHFNRLFYGVGQKLISGWDEDAILPYAKSMDPAVWLPDPLGHTHPDNFRWHAWEFEYTAQEMKSIKGFDSARIDQLAAKKASQDTSLQDARGARNDAGGYNQAQDIVSKTLSKHVMIDIFRNITGSDGITRKYFLTVDSDCSMIVRIDALKPVTDAERANPAEVPFPLALYYYWPLKDDPFGISVPDLTEDKQRARAIYKNLRLAITKSGIYPMYLYDKTAIRNRRSLDFGFNKAIPVSGPVTDSTVRPFQKAPADIGAVHDAELSLESDAEQATATDRNAQGANNVGGRTLGEVEQIQNNANLKTLLRMKVYGWGEKRFWELWYRTYKMYYKGGKEITVSSPLGDQFLEINKRTFHSKKDPRIKIESKLEREAQASRNRAMFGAMIPMITQDPNKPEFSRRFAERKLLRLYDVSDEEVNIMAPETREERFAKQENILLANNEDVEVDANDDHRTHVMCHSVIDTQAARNHINKHLMQEYYLADLEKNPQAGGAQQNAQLNMAQSQFNQQAMQEQPIGNQNIAADGNP